MNLTISTDVLKGTSFDWNKILKEVAVYTIDHIWESVNGTDIKWSLTPKFPACQTFEFKDYFPKQKPLQIFLYFNPIENLAVDLYLEDKNFVLSRTLKSTLLAYSGPKITLISLNEFMRIRMMVNVIQTIDPELDTKKNCTNYPNENFKSYRDCDRQFVYDKMKNTFGLMPFWATDDLNEVTNMRYIYSLVHY